MRKSGYKDLIATGILFGIILLPVSAWLFGKYASHETKMHFLMSIFFILALALLFALWKLIRTIID